MSNLSILALRHQQKRTELSEQVGRRAARLWRSISSGSIDAGWDQIAPQLEQVVTRGQYQAAAMAQGYTAQAARAQGVTGSGAVVTAAFTGVTLEGREVVPELYAAATTTKTLIGRGVGVPAAFQAGTAMMTVIAATMVRDAGVMADKVSGLGRAKRGVMYARMVSPGACSRCAILAGVGHFTKHFERHPSCRCTTVPVYSDDDDLPEGLFSSATDYFESLTRVEQDRVFTKAGAESIRLGADPTSVVNARRGMFRTQQPGSLVARATPRTIIGPDGKPFTAYTTTEGTSVRGWFGGGRGNSRPSGQYYRSASDRYRRTTTVRLMPETIISRSKTPAEAVELLKQFGYMH